MKALIRLEEFAMFLFGIFVFSTLPFAWWWFLVLILVPDLGMIGYLFNNKAGAVLYNLVHHKGIALGIMITGYYLRNDYWILTGAILFAHSSMDRIFGYGLKLFRGFKYTHLGEIGKP
jgi:hypothetical protein